MSRVPAVAAGSSTNAVGRKGDEMIDERLKEKLLSMTWEGLREWSDPKSVERGKGYLDEVETPATFVDGSVMSEVHGSDDYYTKLAVDGKGELQGVCTCPVGRRCKHTVALAVCHARDNNLPAITVIVGIEKLFLSVDKNVFNAEVIRIEYSSHIHVKWPTEWIATRVPLLASLVAEVPEVIVFKSEHCLNDVAEVLESQSPGNRNHALDFRPL